MRISILALVWRATYGIEATEKYKKFQSSPSCGGRLVRISPVFLLYDFNPRPRVEGDDESIANPDNANISILALVWRATNYYRLYITSELISILALVWRATIGEILKM